MHIQATKMTRQELREYSPSGGVQMDSIRGRSFTYPFLIKVALLSLAALAAISSALPQGW